MSLRDNPDALMINEVGSRRYRQGRVVTKVPKGMVASVAKQATDLSGRMVVINAKPPLFSPATRGIIADRATASLNGQHLGVLFPTHSVTGLEVGGVVGILSGLGPIQVSLLLTATDLASILKAISSASVRVEFLDGLNHATSVAEFVPRRDNWRAGAIAGKVSRESSGGSEPAMAIGTFYRCRVFLAGSHVIPHFSPREDCPAISARTVHGPVHRFSRLQVSRTARRIASASFTCQRSAKSSRVFRSSLERSRCNCNSLGCICSHSRPNRYPLSIGEKENFHETFRGLLPQAGVRMTQTQGGAQ